MCNLVRRDPLKSGESSENPVEKIASNLVTSVAVMGFSALIENTDGEAAENHRKLQKTTDWCWAP